MGRKSVFRQDVSCPSCGSHHVVKCGRPLGRQRYLCRDCGKYFLGDATYHHHSRSVFVRTLISSSAIGVYSRL